MPQHRLSLTNFPAVPLLSLVFAVMACLSSSALARGSSNWVGYDGEDPVIWLAVAPAEIKIEAPTPLTGNNLQLLLALSGGASGLGEMREKANRAFSMYLDQEVRERFGEFFEDEEVHLVDAGAPLTLHVNFDVRIRQKILDIVNGKDFDLEKGIMTAYGVFQYRVQGNANGGLVLREGSVDLADLKLKARYRTRAPKDGGTVEDTTREATEHLLAEISEEVIDEVEDALDADALLTLARR